MQGKTNTQMNGLEREMVNQPTKDDQHAKSERPSRKPAIYRSVGIRVPGNDSLMVVHVREY